jgi:hypothetical protein
MVSSFSAGISSFATEYTETTENEESNQELEIRNWKHWVATTNFTTDYTRNENLKIRN